MTWTGLTADTDTGGQAVDYKVYYDKATNGASWTTLASTTSNLTTYTNTDATLFLTGKNYQFKISAFNDFGEGP